MTESCRHVFGFGRLMPNEAPFARARRDSPAVSNVR